MDRSDNFFFSLSQPVPTCFGLKWSLNCACQFFLFFCSFFFFGIFYSWSSRKDQNDNFLFLSFATCPNLFRLEMKPKWWFLIFWIFLPLFFKFSYLDRVGTVRMIIFFSLFLELSRPIFAWNEVWMVFCNFLNFFAIFLKFSILGRLGRIGRIIFFLSFSTRFGLESCLNGVF